MQMTIERPDCSAKFFDALKNRDCKLLVFHGPGGVGKSTLLNALVEEKAFKGRYAICDLRRFSPGVSPDTLGPLYTLCDSVERSKLSKLHRFDLAQQVFSAKTGQPPRAQARSDFGWEFAGYVENVLSAVSVIPGLGSGVQTAQYAYRAFQKLRPRTPLEKQLLEQFRAMQADELAREMPTVLAQDIESSPASKKDIRVVFLDNFDCITPKGGRWIRDLIEATPSILWVAFSRHTLDWVDSWIRKCPVPVFDEAQRAAFWSARLPHAPEADRIAMNKFSDGLPFHMDILAREYESHDSIVEWLKDASAEELVMRVVEELSAEQRELLRLLSATHYFDPPLFRALFPGRSFWAYEPWFRGFLFEPSSALGTEPAFSVRKLYADGVRAGCSALLWQEFHQQIFEYYDHLLTGLETAGTDPQSLPLVALAFVEFCFHGRESSNPRYYLSRLVSLAPYLVRSGRGPALLDEFRKLDQDGFAEKACGTWGLLCCLVQEARLALMQSRYDEASAAIERGLALPDVNTFPLAQLHLLEQRMKLYGTCPPSDIQLTLDAGHKFLDKIRSLSHQLAAAEATRLEMEALSFLGKQYLTLSRESEAKDCLTYAAEIAGDHRKAFAFRLYGALALVQERLGEVFATQGAQAEARALYESALESYTLSTYTDEALNYEFVLNHGLAHKRMAENEFQLGHLEAGCRHIAAALERYNAVAAVAPEIVDIYCKIGWACLCGAEALLGSSGWEAHQANQVHTYLDKAREAIRAGQDWEQNYVANPNPTQHGSRQLDNLLSSEGCLRGTLLERMGRVEEAESAFRNSVDSARIAVEHTKSHPYSHSGLAKSCLVLAEFLIRCDKSPSASVQEGLSAADQALLLAPENRNILALRGSLAALSEQCAESVNT